MNSSEAPVKLDLGLEVQPAEETVPDLKKIRKISNYADEEKDMVPSLKPTAINTSHSSIPQFSSMECNRLELSIFSRHIITQTRSGASLYLRCNTNMKKHLTKKVLDAEKT